MVHFDWGQPLGLVSVCLLVLTCLSVRFVFRAGSGYLCKTWCCILTRVVTSAQALISWGIHGLTKVLLRPALPHQLPLLRAATPKTALWAFQGQTAAILLPLWIPHAIRSCVSLHVAARWRIMALLLGDRLKEIVGITRMIPFIMVPFNMVPFIMVSSLPLS
jgi:hypothetical protein